MYKILVPVLALIVSLESASEARSVLETGKEHLQQARKAYQAGKLADAAKEYLAALTLFEQAGDKAGQAICQTNLGLIYVDLGEYKKSKEFSSKAIKLREGTADKIPLAKNINNLALACMYLGDYEEAIKGFQNALAFNQQMNNVQGAVINLANVGLAYFYLGRYSDALKNYTAALQIVESNDAAAWSQPERWVLMNNIGAVYKKLGQTEKAMELYLKLLQSKTYDKKNEGYLLNNIGTIYRTLGDPIKALDYYMLALQKLGAQSNREIKSLVLKNIGILYLLNLGQFPQAERYLMESLKLSEKAEDKFEQSNCHTYLGELYFNMGADEKAAESFRTALKMAQAISSSETEWIANYGLGRISERREDYDQAYNYYDRAIKEIESIRARLESQQLKASFLIDKVEAYEAMIRSLLLSHNRSPNRNQRELAYHFAERSKARSILDLLNQAGPRFRKGENHELEGDKRQVLDRISKIQGELYKAHSTDNERLTNELGTLERKFESLEFKTIQTDPRYSLLREPKICNTDTVQKEILDERSALLQFFVGKKHIFSWLITKHDVHVLRYEDPTALREKIKALIRSFSHPSDQSHIALAEEIYEALIAPIEKYIPAGTTKLFIIPDGVLYYVPFEALARPAGANGRREYAKDQRLSPSDFKYMIESYDITYTPSASVLKTMEQIPRKGRAGGLLALGDPAFAKENSVPGTSHNATFTVDGKELDRLLYSAQEVLKIEKYVPGKKEIYLQADATERNFKRSAAKGFKVIHLATHTLIDEENIDNSFIVLAAEKGSPEDGLLRVNEIFTLDLDSDLVVLASCRSGMGKLTAGEGIDGFVRAFIYAGTKAIVVSLWEVNDQSTAFFMEQFYYYLGNGVTVDEALRKAKLKFIRSKSYRHPFYWAPFIIIGEAKQSIFKRSLLPFVLSIVLGVLLILVMLTAVLRITQSSRTGP